MSKKLYVIPFVRVFGSLELETPILQGSVNKYSPLTVDPLEESWYGVDDDHDDYLIEF